MASPRIPHFGMVLESNHLVFWQVLPLISSSNHPIHETLSGANALAKSHKDENYIQQLVGPAVDLHFHIQGPVLLSLHLQSYPYLHNRRLRRRRHHNSHISPLRLWLYHLPLRLPHPFHPAYRHQIPPLPRPPPFLL